MYNNLDYNKPYHYIDSPSVLLDLDAVVYILLLALVIWWIVRTLQKIKNKEKISFGDFCATYLYVSYVPWFILFMTQMIISGRYLATNIIISVLPLPYGVLMQLVFKGIIKIYNKRRNIKNGKI